MALNVAYPKNASIKDSVSPAEWQARIDLAAAYLPRTVIDANETIAPAVPVTPAK